MCTLRSVCGLDTNYASTKKKNKNGKFEAQKSIREVTGNSKNKISIFHFVEDENERERWVNTICQVNVNLKVANETIICEKHLPKLFLEDKGFWEILPKDSTIILGRHTEKPGSQQTSGDENNQTSLQQC